MASYILYEQKGKIGEKSIIAAAAKLIKDEQRDLEKMNKAYPTFGQLSDICNNRSNGHLKAFSCC